MKAVDDESFLDQKGREVFTLVGESGCGKSMTGQVGCETPSNRRQAERSSTNRTSHKMKKEEFRICRRKLQIIFQDPYASLNPRMKVGRAVEHPLKIHDLAKGVAGRQKVVEILQRVGLTPPEQFINLYPHQLSGGQRQRVAMARSLILDPEFIVADEPVSMIDVSLRTTIIDLMLELRKELDLTYLFITHDLAIAKYISDTIAIMYLGKIFEVGDKKEIFSNPIHGYIAGTDVVNSCAKP